MVEVVMGPEPEKMEVGPELTGNDTDTTLERITEKALLDDRRLTDINPRIIVALDYPSGQEAMTIVSRLDPAMCRLKIGKELHSVAGPQFVKWCIDLGFDVFLDLKFHDIPTTVAKACMVNAKLGVWMMNMHASGGSKMMCAARKAVDELGLENPPLLIAVTVLTSMGGDDLEEIGVPPYVPYQVKRLAKLARECGLDGVVCSPKEVALLRRGIAHDFLLVTPGISLSGSQRDDQKRVMTPVDAIRAGSSYLVIGRPVTQSEDPIATLGEINESIAEAA